MLFHGFYILSTQPLIISYTANNSRLPVPGLINQVRKDRELKYSSLPSWFRPTYILEHVGCWAVPWHRMTRYGVKQSFHFLQKRYHHLIVNAPDENIARKRFFIRGAQFSVSLYINENLYKPSNVSKIYDAIYTAQLEAFKRHSLAKNVERLMVVSYGGDLHTFCPSLKHADSNKEFLSRTELAEKYSQSYTGLCLSAAEGAMLASCEYLLCGIPVVSTPSVGGRDQFFDDQNSIIVPPQAEAVAKAVDYWKTHPPDPEEIRRLTLKRMNHLRYGYCTYIADLIAKGGGGKKAPEMLMEKYFGAPEGTLARFVKLNDLWNVDPGKFHLDY